MASGSVSIKIDTRKVCEGGYAVSLNAGGKKMPIYRLPITTLPLRDGPYNWAGHYVYLTHGDAPDLAIIVGIATNPEAARRVIEDDKTARAIEILTGHPATITGAA